MEKFALFVLIFAFSAGNLAACQPPSKPENSRRSAAVEPKSDKEKKPENQRNTDDSDVTLENKPEEDGEEDDKKEQDDVEQTTDCYKADESICAMEREIWSLTNDLRKQKGLPPLTLSPELSWAARQWSEKMGGSGFISHLGFPRQRQQDYQKEFGTSASMSAENVAMTFSGASNVAGEFYRMWENSSGHRANMLSRNATIGIGIARNSRGGWYATQIFGR